MIKMREAKQNNESFPYKFRKNYTKERAVHNTALGEDLMG